MRILIPLDSSKLAEAAVNYVEELMEALAPNAKLEVILLHVIVPVKHVIAGVNGSVELPPDGPEMAQIHEGVIVYLEQVGDVLKNKGIGVTCKVVIGENPAEDIIKAEREMNAEMVVMSTHGRSGISRWALGSVADKVVRRGTAPVLLVRVQE